MSLLDNTNVGRKSVWNNLDPVVVLSYIALDEYREFNGLLTKEQAREQLTSPIREYCNWYIRMEKVGSDDYFRIILQDHPQAQDCLHCLEKLYDFANMPQDFTNRLQSIDIAEIP